MAVQMVRSDVCDRGHIRMEIHDGLKLEAGNLRDGNGLVCGFKSVSGVRITDVSYYEYALIELSHDLACEAVVVVFPFVPVIAVQVFPFEQR